MISWPMTKVRLGVRRHLSSGRQILAKWVALIRCLTRDDFGAASARRAGATSLLPLSTILMMSLLIVVRPIAVSAATPTPAAQDPSITELEQLVDTLKDDKARQAFVVQLQTLIAAQRAEPVKPDEPRDLISVMSHRIDALAEEVLAGATVLVDAPLLLTWVKEQIVDETTRARWIQVAYSLVIVFGAGLIAEWITRRLLARVLPRAPAHIRRSVAIRVLLAAGGLIIEALPIAAFAVVALAALAMTVPSLTAARYALSGLIEATIAVRLIFAIASAVLVPAYAEGILIPAGEETRTYLLIWIRRFTCWGIFGYAIASAGWWLGASGSVYALMLKTSVLVLAILGIVFILQNRAPVARWIHGSDRAESVGLIRLRSRIAEIWHIPAILYIGVIYLVYALRAEGGGGYILRATLVSLVVIAGARLLLRFIEQLSTRGFAIAPDLKARFPELEKRVCRFSPEEAPLQFMPWRFSWCCRAGTLAPSPGSRRGSDGRLLEPSYQLRL